MLRRCLLSLLLFGMALSPASAAWLGFRNDMNQAVVVQTYTECKSGARLGTPHRLYPGETTWDWVSDNNTRKLQVTDARSSKTILLRGADIPVGKDDILYGLQGDAKSVQARKVWEGTRPR